MKNSEYEVIGIITRFFRVSPFFLQVILVTNCQLNLEANVSRIYSHTFLFRWKKKGRRIGGGPH